MRSGLCSFLIIIAAKVDFLECAEEFESTSEFSDLYKDGIAPEWPEDFGDRLSVIKFNFVRNSTSGRASLSGDNGF